LQEVSALFVPQEIAHEEVKPQGTAQDLKQLKSAIDILTLKFYK
jgi:hypothetical protein